MATTTYLIGVGGQYQRFSPVSPWQEGWLQVGRLGDGAAKSSIQRRPGGALKAHPYSDILPTRSLLLIVPFLMGKAFKNT